MNDELEADSSPPSTRRSVDDDEADNDGEVDDANALRPKVAQIEEELQELKERLEEGIAGMETLKQQLLPLVSAEAPQISQKHASVALNGNERDENGGIAVGQAVRGNESISVGSEGESNIDPDNSRVGIDTLEGKQLQSDGSADDEAGSLSSSDSDEDESGDERGSDQRSRGITTNSPPLTPTSGMRYTPPLSPKSNSSNLSPPLSPQSTVSGEATTRDNGDNEDDTEFQRSSKGGIARSEAESDSSVDGEAQSDDGSDDEDAVVSEHSRSAVDAGPASVSEGVVRDSDSEGEQTTGGGAMSNREDRDDDDGGSTPARSALSSSLSEGTRSLDGNDERDGSESDTSTEHDNRQRKATPGGSEVSGSDKSGAEESADEGSVSSGSGVGSPTRSSERSSDDHAPITRRK